MFIIVLLIGALAVKPPGLFLCYDLYKKKPGQHSADRAILKQRKRVILYWSFFTTSSLLM